VAETPLQVDLDKRVAILKYPNAERYEAWLYALMGVACFAYLSTQGRFHNWGGLPLLLGLGFLLLIIPFDHLRRCPQSRITLSDWGVVRHPAHHASGLGNIWLGSMWCGCAITAFVFRMLDRDRGKLDVPANPVGIHFLRFWLRRCVSEAIYQEAENGFKKM